MKLGSASHILAPGCGADCGAGAGSTRAVLTGVGAAVGVAVLAALTAGEVAPARNAVAAKSTRTKMTREILRPAFVRAETEVGQKFIANAPLMGRRIVQRPSAICKEDL